MKPLFLVLSAIFLTMVYSCSSDDLGGNCSISCGGFGTGQPFVQTNTAFVSEEECKQLGIDKNNASCKASFCPPTGNSNDCYQVHP